MSAEITHLVPFDELPLSQRVIRNIRAEMARYDVQQAQLAAALGVTSQAVSQKLSGRRHLSIDELDVIAGVLRMTPEELIRGMRNPRQGRGPDGGGGSRLPRLDLNQQPSDLASAQVTALRSAHVIPLRTPSERAEEVAA